MKEQNLVSKWYVGLTVLLVIIGIIMLVWPNLTMDLLGIMIGICMLVVGLVHVIIYFTREHMGSVMQMDLTVGVVLAAFGAFMLMHKDFVALLLPFAASVILMVGGLSLLQNALDMRQMAFARWQIMLGFAIAMLAMGAVLLYNPFKDRVLIYVIGACLIIDGLASITAILMISHRFKKMARGAVYTGSDNLLTDQEAQRGAFGKKGKQNAGMNASGPVETVDNPVMAEPKAEKNKKKSGLFGLFGKKKKDDPQQEGSAQTDASGQDVWNSADADDSFGSDMPGSYQDGASGFAGTDASSEAAAFTVPDEPAVNALSASDEPAASNDFSAADDPFTPDDDAAGDAPEESGPAADGGSAEGAAGDGEIKDPFDLG